MSLEVEPHIFNHLPPDVLTPMREKNLAILEKEAPSSMEIVLDEDFADPMVIAPSDGEIYAYGTETTRPDGSLIHLQGAYSSNGKDFELVHHDLFPTLPDWAVGVHVWAPFVRVDAQKGEYQAYLSVRTKNGHQAITMARSTDPMGPFVDESTVPITWAFRFGENTHIDPFVYDNTMIWGSAGLHLMEKQLTQDGAAFMDSTTLPTYILDALPGDFYERMMEGVFLDLTQEGEEVDIYYSGSDTFGNGFMEKRDGQILKPGEYAILSGKYNKRTHTVTRRTETGLGYQDNIFLEGNKRFKNLGNNSVVKISGRKYSYQAGIDRENPYFPNSRMNRRPVTRVEIQEDENGFPTPK